MTLGTGPWPHFQMQRCGVGDAKQPKLMERGGSADVIDEFVRVEIV
jgi:hypothetical protein